MRTMLRIRIGQQMINERYKAGDFKVPIHLALGHEAVAAAVSEAMHDLDQLIVSHRNDALSPGALVVFACGGRRVLDSPGGNRRRAARFR